MDGFIVDGSLRTRPASLPSSDEDATIKKPVLLLASPSGTAGRGRALEPRPTRRAPARRSRPLRVFESMCRSLPLFHPSCGRQARPGAATAPGTAADSLLLHLASAASPGTPRRRLTGTLFGYRNCRVSLALQGTARCVPDLVVELAVPTHVLLRELGAMAGARIVLECEKRAPPSSAGWRDDDVWVLEEPMWTMFCNGKRVGYAVRREPNGVDVEVLEALWAVSMGGGVLPSISDVDDGPDGEMAYMRGSFDHIVGSRDSESLYMVGPPGGDCPELAVFFVRL
jgi:uncharacterized protein (TIGR01570 family)